MIIITNMMYPYPSEKKTWFKSLHISFDILDLIDLAELIFADFGCYTVYEENGAAFFFITTGLSVTLSTFTTGLERIDENDNPTFIDRITTISNMIVNDIFFLILRLTVVSSNGKYIAPIFLTKEIISLLIRFKLLCKPYIVSQQANRRHNDVAMTSAHENDVVI